MDGFLLRKRRKVMVRWVERFLFLSRHASEWFHGGGFCLYMSSAGWVSTGYINFKADFKGRRTNKMT